MKSSTFIGFALAALVTAAPALAQEKAAGGTDRREAMFQRMDANGDGKLTRAEVDAYYKAAADRLMSKRDFDKNGEITREEFTKRVPRTKKTPAPAPAPAPAK
ncbi:MAG TPA: EF-hand domain-containing protein [Magnetospirillum sp.]|nr:EF-hand domain-containing protein [Magnetospirillum sp.]